MFYVDEYRNGKLQHEAPGVETYDEAVAVALFALTVYNRDVVHILAGDITIATLTQEDINTQNRSIQ